MLKGKIHRATVTQAELDYVGSITIDTDLLNASGIRDNPLVVFVDNNNKISHIKNYEKHGLLVDQK